MKILTTTSIIKKIKEILLIKHKHIYIYTLHINVYKHLI
jgi:hypothetical protein